MNNPAPQPDMAWHLRRLLEAVTGAAWGLEGRWGWLGVPLALLTWFRTRRERREAAEAMRAVQALLEGFLGMLEDFRAGRLVGESALEVDAPTEPDDAVEQGANGMGGGVAPPPPRLVRFAAQPPASAGEGARGMDGAVAPPPPRPSPVEGEGEGNGAGGAVARPPPQPSPAKAGEGANGADGAVATPPPPALPRQGGGRRVVRRGRGGCFACGARCAAAGVPFCKNWEMGMGKGAS